MREAAGLPLVLITAWEGLVDRARVRTGHKVLVHGGAGGVGHVAVQIARAFGAEVFATGSARHQAIIEDLGATFIDRHIPIEAYVAQHTAGEGFDIVYDTVGGEVLDASFRAARVYHGHVVSCLGWGQHSLAPLSFRAATYSGVFTLLPLLTGVGREHHGDILREAARLIEAGKLRPLMDARTFTFENAETAHALLASLRPRPSSGFDQGETHYVAPDILVVKRQQRWVARLNQGTLPKLRVNQMYAGMLQQKGSSHNLGGQLQEARWLVKNIQQRFDTILKVAESIVDRQQAFFEQGEVAMRPLILRDIAEELGLHESTISRVTTQKYLLCSRGLFELKYFFGSSVDTDSGGECSATAIKALIRQIIDAEDHNKPLSDSAIADKLIAQGIQVARRTVAKYREAMQIPPVSQRKTF